MNEARFKNREHAGRAIAERLTAYRGRPGVLVLGLPRGGVPVAAEVARAIDAPLDVLIVRKIGFPQQPEFAMGAMAAIAGNIETVRNQYAVDLVAPKDARDEVFDHVAAREREELKRRQHAYRDDRPPLEVAGRTVILVDDGLATGATMRAAVAAVARERPARLVAAVPVGSAEACAELRDVVDELVCVSIPEPFWAVGQAYETFEQTTDDEVRRLLEDSS
jgi:putative phosphoribosyl transferase